MSGDPFANTTTVKNILQHIISPKIVSNGSGGYLSKTDLVNVHNIVFAAGASTEDGSLEKPFTTQCGVLTTANGDNNFTIYHSRVSASSIIMACCNLGDVLVTSVAVAEGSFTIYLSQETIGYKIGWFIAKF